MPATHLVFPILDRPAASTTREGVRRVVTAVLEACDGAPLLAFHLSDSHLHVLVALDRVAAGRLARKLRLKLHSVLGPSVTGTNHTAIRDAAHLANTFEYVLRNDEKHGVAPDPWRENGALPDLLGLRVLPSTLIREVRRTLPRIHGADLRAMAGWPEIAPSEAPASAAAALTAALAVLALPDLSGRSPAVLIARRAVAGLLAEGAPRSAAAALKCSADTARRLASSPVPPEVLRSIKLHLSLQAAVPLPPASPYPLQGSPTPWAARARFTLGARRT